MKKIFNFNKGFANFGNHFFQAVLIIFSVVFALFINKYTESLQLKKEKELALQSIARELQNNQKVLEVWNKKHTEVAERIDSLLLLPEEELRRIFIKEQTGDFNFSAFIGESSFVNNIMTSTAWETAKTTGIINEFDYGQIKMLTQTYELQNLLVYSTLNNFLDVMKDRQTFNPEQINTTLLLFKWALKEMVGQEILLGQVYEVLINELGK